MSYLFKLNTFLKLLFQINIEIKTNIKAQSRTSKRPRPRDTWLKLKFSKIFSQPGAEMVQTFDITNFDY